MSTTPLTVRTLALLALFAGACEESMPGGVSGTGGSGGSKPGTGGAAGATTGSGGNGMTGSGGTGGASGTMGGGGTTGTGGSGGSGGAGGTGGAAPTDGGADARDAIAAPADGPGGETATNLPRGKSAGCGKAAPAGDSSSAWTKHDINVTGVDPAFITAHPANVGGYNWTRRNYFVRLPANYNTQTGYAVHFGGGGCGNTNGLSGDGGGFPVSGAAPGAIQIGLSYVYDNGACFKDEYPNTPELPYFDAVMKELDANYCFDKSKVFIAGYSSGAWESYTLGFARGGVIRGIATAAGGLRMNRPPATRVPFAALLLTGLSDGNNPISGATGSAAARDMVLQTNGCVGTATVDWPMMASCKQYTGCPAAYPVIFCTPAAEHTDGGGGYKTVVSNFWGSLPSVP